MLESGMKIPPFKVLDSLGNEVTEAVFAGTRTLLFFYPKAMTGG